MCEEKRLDEEALAGVTGGHDQNIGGIVDPSANGGVLNNPISSPADEMMSYGGITREGPQQFSHNK